MTLDLKRYWQDLLAGWPELLKERPDYLFDSRFYYAEYTELDQNRHNAHSHFQSYGRAEGRFANRYCKLRDRLPALDHRLRNLITEPNLLRALAQGQEGAHELAFEAIMLRCGIDARISDFSADYYCRLYPDIVEAGIEPFEHYIQFGIREKRQTLRAVRHNFYTGFAGYDPAKPVCMIAVHEFSRSGAPIVGLDMVKSAAKNNNVIVVSLRDGPLLEEFRHEAVWVFVSERLNEELDLVLPDMTGMIKFAILNSVETFPFVRFLVAQDIPFATYLHEYTEYTRPAYKAICTVLYSDLLAYSSTPVCQSWAMLHADMEFDRETDAIVVPQAELHFGKVDRAGYDAARTRIGRMIGCDLTGKRLVFGAGHAQWRKGTDLFVLTAQMCRESDPDTVFIWIGDGLNHEDIIFGVWLDKHMTEAGTGDPGGNLFFLPAGSYYHDLMRAADTMFLSSRLDPLPNVVFDATRFGCNVVMFKNASGFDDAIYTDRDELTSVEFGNLDAVRQAIREQPLKISECGTGSAADTEPGKVDAFAEISTALLHRMDRQRYFVSGGGDYDVSVIFSSEARDAGARQRERERIWTRKRRFIWRSRAEAEAALEQSDNWLHQNIRITGYAAQAPGDLVADKTRTAGTETLPRPEFSIHVHAYYTEELADDIRRYAAYHLARRIVVTTDTAKKERQIEDIFATHGLSAEVLRVPNQGRDILPFMRLFHEDGPGCEDEIWAHVHQKKSIGSARDGDVWRAFLMTILLGDDQRISTALAEIGRDSVGLVGAFDPYISGWAGSRRLIPAIESRLAGTLPRNPLLFPIGNMFWARRGVVDAMNAVFGPDYPWPNEPIANDGTVFHLIERLWPAVTAGAGLKTVFVEKSDQKRA